jgi:hypothetical protein|tara:strand:- start:732 stop:1127 length:396 start_codon:yes stop_codon:yes gene_type:complete
MNDVDRLVAKLTKKSKVEETPKAEPEQEPVEEEVVEDDKSEDEEDPIEEDEEVTEKKDEKVAKKEDPKIAIENEVAILQNNGVFRREILISLNDLVAVMKVNTQTLIDIKKSKDQCQICKEKTKTMGINGK